MFLKFNYFFSNNFTIFLLTYIYIFLGDFVYFHLLPEAIVIMSECDECLSIKVRQNSNYPNNQTLGVGFFSKKGYVCMYGLCHQGLDYMYLNF